MAGYLGTKAVLLSTTAATVTGDAEIAGDLTVDTNTLVVDSTNNNVGIGTSLPAAQLHLAGQTNGTFRVDTAASGYLDLSMYSNGGFVATSAAQPLRLGTNNTERMRIDASGNVLVGKTSAGTITTSGMELAPSYAMFAGTNASTFPSVYVGANGSSGGLIEFYYQSTKVGSIGTNGSTTSYNTSSDYRLKEDWQPMTGASDRVLALKPVNFAWKADGSRVDGFLAHEAQEVVPEAVHGVKDGMREETYEVTPAVYDDEGNLVSEAVIGTREVPDYQGIDQSKLVPLLTAALQEALTEIAALKDRVAALEAN